MIEISDQARGAARDALFRDFDSLTRWCGTCSGETCDDCIAIRDEAVDAVLGAIGEEIWKQAHGWCDDGIDGMCQHQPGDTYEY